MSIRAKKSILTTAILATEVFAWFLGYLAISAVVLIAATTTFVALYPFKKLRGRTISAILQTALCLQFRGFMGHSPHFALEVTNVEFATQRGTIFCANHISLLDPLILLSFIPNAGVLIKKKYERVLTIFMLTKIFDFIIVDESSPNCAEETLKKVSQALKDGRNMLIFPEGERTKNGRVLEFKNAAFKLAKMCEAAVVPISMYSSNPFLVKDSPIFPNGGSVVKIKFFSPLQPKTFRSAQKLAETSYDKISDSVNKQRYAKKS